MPAHIPRSIEVPVIVEIDEDRLLADLLGAQIAAIDVQVKALYEQRQSLWEARRSANDRSAGRPAPATADVTPPDGF